MKKILALVLSVVMIVCLTASASAAADNVIRVGATPAPHAEILEQIKEVLAKAAGSWRSWSSTTM